MLFRSDSTGLQLGRHVAMPRSKLYAHELNAVVDTIDDVFGKF